MRGEFAIRNRESCPQIEMSMRPVKQNPQSAHLSTFSVAACGQSRSWKFLIFKKKNKIILSCVTEKLRNKNKK